MLKDLKTLLPIIIFIGFFLSYTKWYTYYLGLINLSFAILSTLVIFSIIILVFEYWSLRYGLIVEFHRVVAIGKFESFSALFGKLYKYKINFPMDIFLLAIFGFATYGVFFPIIVALSFSPISYKRIGKEMIEPTHMEKSEIIFNSFVSLWFIYSIIKYVSELSPIFEGFIGYYFKILFMFTLSSVIPFQLLLLPLFISTKIKEGYNYPTIGDILMMVPTYKQLAIIITMLLLPILSMVLPPIFYLISAIVLQGILWIRYRFRYEYG